MLLPTALPVQRPPSRRFWQCGDPQLGAPSLAPPSAPVLPTTRSYTLGTRSCARAREPPRLGGARRSRLWTSSTPPACSCSWCRRGAAWAYAAANRVVVDPRCVLGRRGGGKRVTEGEGEGRAVSREGCRLYEGAPREHPVPRRSRPGPPPGRLLAPRTFGHAPDAPPPCARSWEPSPPKPQNPVVLIHSAFLTSSLAASVCSCPSCSSLLSSAMASATSFSTAFSSAFDSSFYIFSLLSSASSIVLSNSFAGEA